MTEHEPSEAGGTIRVDGAQGEGGGQVLRSSLGLSMVTGRPVIIERIRAGRDKPGLMRAHLTAVEAATAVSGAAVEGATIGSGRLTFAPGPIRAGSHAFSVGTAGSGTLVLQTILPALLLAPGPSTVTIEGGTHNPWAPTFDFLDRVYLPLVRRMGPVATATLERHGFYPAGGGRFSVRVEPTGSLAGFDLLERGDVIGRRVQALVSNLPERIGEREVRRVIERMSWDRACGRTDAVVAHGPGNVVEVEIEATGITERFTAFGRAGASAERVAEELIGQVRDHLVLGAPVGCFLADQLLLPLGISAWLPEGSPGARGGVFRTGPLSRHATTHIDVLRQCFMKKIYVLNGPNLNMLGAREPDIYGHESYADMVTELTAFGVQLDLDVEIRQTNDESELVSWLQEAFTARFDVVLNPAAFTHYSYSVRDAVAMLTSAGSKVIEVHISNPHAREEFRHNSVISGVATGVIAGFGLDSYKLALRQLAN